MGMDGQLHAHCTGGRVDLNRREFEFLYLLEHCKGHGLEDLVEAPCCTPEGRGCFHWPNSSDGTKALGSTQPLTELSTRGKRGRCVGLTTLPPSCAECLEILEASTSLSPKSLSRPVQVLLYLFLLAHCI